MMPESQPKISVIIPVFGKSGDLERLVQKLNKQTLKPHEIIVVDSNPQPLEKLPAGVRHVVNPEDIAYGWDYNLGAQHATGDYLLNTSQDCLPEDDRALEEVFTALTTERVAVTAMVTLPKELWEQYNFWGQVMMARWVGEIRQGISEKFDLMRVETFRKIGGYDIQTFRFCGQDQDLYLRLRQQGEVHVAPTRILHLHKQPRGTSCIALIKKEFLLAESFGALFRKWGFQLRRAAYAGNWTHHLAKYLYPLLLALPFAPKTAAIALLILTNLTHMEAWRIRSPKVLVMLVLNPVLFLVGAAGTARGLITGKQRYSVFK
jgi:glycosyltransferase involved in cell wall biosynthesis